MDAGREERRGEIVSRFGELLRSGDDAIPLDEVVLLIAACHHPRLDVLGELARLDDIAAECPSPTIEGVLRHLFDTMGFHGNLADYDDPANSFLDLVVRRRMGLPISLSVLAIEVARRVGVGLVGVGLPGHFVLGVPGDPHVFFDAFDGGRRLDVDGVRAIVEQSTGGASGHLDDSWFRPVGPTAIVVRMLNNLKGTYVRRGRTADLRWVMQLRSTIPLLGAQEADEFARLMAPTN